MRKNYKMNSFSTEIMDLHERYESLERKLKGLQKEKETIAELVKMRSNKIIAMEKENAVRLLEVEREKQLLMAKKDAIMLEVRRLLRIIDAKGGEFYRLSLVYEYRRCSEEMAKLSSEIEFFKKKHSIENEKIVKINDLIEELDDSLEHDEELYYLKKDKEKLTRKISILREEIKYTEDKMHEILKEIRRMNRKQWRKI